jgi:adenosylcobinamide-phosphate synthase
MELFYIIFGALLLDAIIGDPQLSFHPVALMGKFALKLEPIMRKKIANDFFSGMICTLIIIFASAFSAYLLVNFFGITATIFCLFVAIALKSLLHHVTAIERPLRIGALNRARYEVGMITSRDTNVLDEAGIIRSALESIGENIIDGVTAPIFYATLGWYLGGVTGAAAGALFYRAANTLDATFGYRNHRYKNFGTFPARLDDVLNFIPARITLIAIYIAALLSKLYAINAVKYAWRDRKKHPSPNSTWGMAAFAGALGVKLGGPTCYKGQWKQYPNWGIEYETLNIKHLKQAKKLAMFTTLIFSSMMLTVLFL